MVKPNVSFSFCNVNIGVFDVLDFYVHLVPFGHLPRSVNDVRADVVLDEFVGPFVD